MAIYRGPGGSGDAITDAASQATVATTKAAEAAASASAASSSATSAATEATNASTSASNSATSATASASSAAAASTSETNAASSATNASTSASNAATSATNAATSETNAANSASAAATSATNAATSASNASTSETNAASSATSSATSATNAATSETNAAASYDSFDDRYLGAKSSAPSVDNDGDALLTGALYWNTGSNQLFVWAGSAWEEAAFSISGSVTSFNTRTGVVTLSASDVNTALGSDAVLDSDIGSTVQAHSAVLDATTASYTTAEETKLAGIETAATADQTAGEIKTAYESNADTNAFTDAEQTKLAGIEALADVTDTLNVTAAGALMDSELTSEASVKALNQGVATTDSPSFAGLTVDTDTLAVDSTNNRVGIGTTSPANHLEVAGAIVAQGAATAYTNTGLYLQNKGSSVVDVGAWRSGASVAELSFSTDSGSDAAPVERMRIDSSGNVGIGTSSPTYKFQIAAGTDSSVTYATSALNGNIFFDTQNTSTGASASIVQRLITSDVAGTGTISADIQKTKAGALNINNNETNSAAHIGFGVSGSERMRIDSSGKLGIGTSSPAATVDVSGNARGAVVTDNDLSFDLSAGNNFSCTPSGAGTLTFTNHLAGQSGFVWLDNSGGHAIAAAGTTKINAADLTTISTAGVYTLAYFDNGTNAYVSVSRSFA